MNKKFVIVIAAVIIIALAAIFLVNKPQAEVPSREVVLVVNGEPIYADEILAEYNTIPAAQRNATTEDKIMSFIIEKKILLQAAKKEGIIVNQEEVAAMYNGYTNPENLMAEQNMTQEEFLLRLEEQVLINNLFDKAVAAAPPVIKKEEVQQIYDLNYKSKNISFDEAEPKIVDFLLKNREAIIKAQYLASLNSRAVVQKVEI